MIDAGHDPRRFATDLLERFRDLIVLQAVPDAVATRCGRRAGGRARADAGAVDADRHRHVDPLRRGGARRPRRDARRHGAAAVARGGVRAAAAARRPATPNRRCCSASSASRPAWTCRFPRANSPALRSSTAARARRRTAGVAGRTRTEACPDCGARTDGCARAEVGTGAEARARADGGGRADTDGAAEGGRAAGRAHAGSPPPVRQPSDPVVAAPPPRRSGVSRTPRRCAACGRRCGRRSVSAAAPPR